MSTSSFIEVIIGLSFIYLFLSLINVVITEIITRSGNSRHKLIKSTLANLLQKYTKIANKEQAVELIEKRLNSMLGGGKITKYTRISAKTLALAFYELFEETGGKTLPKGEKSKSKLEQPDVISIFKKTADRGKKIEEEIINKLTEWMDSVLDKISEFYKRKAQLIVLITAFIIVTIANADTIKMAKQLNDDSAMRSSIVAAAEVAAKEDLKGDENKKFIKEMQEKIEESDLPFGPQSWAEEEVFQKTEKKVPNKNTPTAAERVEKKEKTNLFWWFVLKILGLLTTTMMVSLGAPFWFDALKKIVQVRKTVKKIEQNVADS